MKPKPKRPLTPAQVKARIATHKPRRGLSLLHDKLDLLTFPPLKQGADKLTEGKRLACILRMARHTDPGFPPANMTDEKIDAWLMRAFVNKDTGRLSLLAGLGLRLERAVLDKSDPKPQSDFREASRYLPTSKMSDVYRFLLMGHHNKNRREKGYRKIEDLSRAELWRLVKKEFPTLQLTDRPTLYRMWKEIFPDVR